MPGFNRPAWYCLPRVQAISQNSGNSSNPARLSVPKFTMPELPPFVTTLGCVSFGVQIEISVDFLESRFAIHCRQVDIMIGVMGAISAPVQTLQEANGTV